MRKGAEAAREDAFGSKARVAEYEALMQQVERRWRAFPF